MNKHSEVGCLCKNVHGFYWYYRPLTVTAFSVVVAPVVVT